MFGFLGPNSAGKTTTVRTLGTLIAPTSGSATVAGMPLTPENGVEIRRRISIMPESPGLYLRLSVAENLECFADLYEVARPARAHRPALRAVNLADRADDACGALSKGLRQRVALARALLSDPEVLFLDEPTSGLDPVAARDVHELIDGLRRSGVTIFLTTHRLEEAERLCDRVAILNTTLRTIGRPDELRDQLFARTLTVKTLAPLAAPGRRLRRPAGGRQLAPGRPATYVLAVSDAAVAAPAVTRALVAAGADVLSIGESRHSLEDVYLELIDEDDEAGEDEHEQQASPGHLPQGAARVPAQPLDRRDDGDHPADLRHPPADRDLRAARVVGEAPPRARAAVHARHPGDRAGYVAAYSVVGERQQGTLEPVLTTPIRREELLLGKALAALVPSLAVSYAVYAPVLACVELFARSGRGIRAPPRPGTARPAALHAAPRRLVDLARHGDLHPVERSAIAQQFGMLASLPSIAVTTLIAYDVIHVTLALALGLAAALLLANSLGWRLVSAMFDRERLITPTK